MKTNYYGHDTAYQHLLAQGMIGWDKTEEAYTERKKAILEFLNSIHASTNTPIIELGCGAGNISIHLLQNGYNVTGVDISPTAVEWAKSRCEKANITANFIISNVLQLSQVEAHSFDIALDSHCFHCIICNDRELFLREIHRILKPGGHFLVDTMCGPVNSIEGYDPTSQCVLVSNIATRYFGIPETIQAEIKSAGFDIVSTSLQRETTHSNAIIHATKVN